MNETSQMSQQPVKRCSTCRLTKPIDQFHRHRGNADGLQRSCKTCAEAYRIAYQKGGSSRDAAKKRRELNKSLNQLKQCRSCNEIKPITDYSRSRKIKDGYNSQCRACERLHRHNYRANHPEKHRKSNRAWQQKHHEQVLARIAEWRRTNPDKFFASIHNRRAELAGAEGRFTAEELRALRIAQAGICAYCKCTGCALQIDHITPLAQNGRGSIDNIALACRRCNASKNNRTPEQWIKAGRWFERPAKLKRK